MHDWIEDRPANYSPQPPSGRPKPPWWKCSKCGTRAESWLAPSSGLKVRISNSALKAAEMGLLSCDEYVTYQVMEA